MSLKYQVFVSSTYDDLKREREQVIRATLEMGHIPVGMEMFSAGDEEQWKLIQRTIDECDYYIVVLANRYGSEIDGISYTEKEYDYALAKGIPVIGLILDEGAPWPTELADRDHESVGRLRIFKEKVRRKSVSIWKNTEDLYAKASIALMKVFNINPQIGWIRADKATSEESTEEILQLRKTIDLLKHEITSYKERMGEIIQAYAQSEEPIVLEGKLNIVDSNSPTYKRIVVEKNVEFNLTTTWNAIFSVLLPTIVSFPSEQQIRNSLAKIIRDRIKETKITIEDPNCPDNVRISSETYNLVKVQLLALRFAELVENPPAWRLTESGREKMYHLLAQKAEQSHSAARE